MNSCSKCGSDDISVRYLAPFMSEGFVFFGGFVGVLPNGTLVMKCQRCGFRWGERPKDDVADAETLKRVRRAHGHQC